MCQKYESIGSSPSTSTIGNLVRKIWPLPPYIAFLVIALLPTQCYLNRGFTIWFHWMAVAYLLTQSRFLQKFQILIGTSICLGWYAALIYEYTYHGRFMDALHKNMPAFMVAVMVKDGKLDFESQESVVMMCISHLLDLLGHPILTYYFWRQHRREGGRLSDVLSWPVVISAYMYSRLWSLTHTFYNQGKLSLFYMGFDVYVIDSLDSWYPPYISESLVFVSIVLWKVFVEEKESCVCSDESKKPHLVYSESSVSIE